MLYDYGVVYVEFDIGDCCVFIVIWVNGILIVV